MYVTDFKGQLQKETCITYTTQIRPCQLNIVWLVIFAGTAKKAKIQVSEVFTVLIFAVGESGTCELASGMTKS